VQALYHWDFDADQQFGEVDYGTGAVQLSYWVDYWLGTSFPSNAGSQRLQYVSFDDADLETLALKNSDNSVVVMVANHAVNASGDNNGPGVLKTVARDLSALGTFSSGSLVTIDKKHQYFERPDARHRDAGVRDHDDVGRIFGRISGLGAIGPSQTTRVLFPLADSISDRIRVRCFQLERGSRYSRVALS
jgi:hypothetical protein